MKPFQARTKTGLKWYVADGNSLVEVAAEDVPEINARMDADKWIAQMDRVVHQHKVDAELQEHMEETTRAMLGTSTHPSYPNWSHSDH